MTATTSNLAAIPAGEVGGRRFRFLVGRARTLFALGYGLAALAAAGAIFLTAAAPGGRDLQQASGAVVALLVADLFLIAALTVVAGRRVLTLFGAGSGDAGVRLHRRFVTLFAIAAVAPAIIVALFFGLLVNRGVESWFSARVRTAVEDSAKIGRAYLQEQTDATQQGLAIVAADLNSNAAFLQRSPLGYGKLMLQELASRRDFVSIYLIDHEGRVLGRAEQGGAPPYVAPPPEMTRPQPGGEAPLRLDEKGEVARAVFRLTAYPDAYLYVVRPLGAGIMEQLRNSYDSISAYRQSAASRERIQAIFMMSYVATALLVLLGAVWVGVALAGQIAAPVARLVQAADRVAGGDLTARVLSDGEPAELAVLTRAFNRMTHDLGEQQHALRLASREAQDRRAFIEAVLSGVSAGVVGLDGEGRISAVNSRALTLLDLKLETTAGATLEAVAPEFAETLARHLRTGADAEAELDVVRGGETRRLRVRAAGGGEGGVVLTFDDITRLMAAQRSAAWRDVARRIAHEIKNPLTPIQLSAERIRRKYRKEITSDLETFDRCTDTIVRQVGDIGRMVDEFSAFARMPAPVFATQDAAELLREAVFAQRVAYADIAVELDDPGAPEPLSCDARMIGQALANVLKNAGEAVAARVLADPSRGPGLIQARFEDAAGLLAIVVEDDGVGLPAKDRERLVEPYVTTREKGTGLGLAIVRRICEEHGGELILRDAARLSGARVELRFPRPARPSGVTRSEAVAAE